MAKRADGLVQPRGEDGRFAKIDWSTHNFLMRYIPPGAKEYRPPIIDNVEGRRAMWDYMDEVEAAEARFLEETANYRFVGV